MRDAGDEFHLLSGQLLSAPSRYDYHQHAHSEQQQYAETYGKISVADLSDGSFKRACAMLDYKSPRTLYRVLFVGKSEQFHTSRSFEDLLRIRKLLAFEAAAVDRYHIALGYNRSGAGERFSLDRAVEKQRVEFAESHAQHTRIRIPFRKRVVRDVRIGFVDYAF